MKVLYFSNYEVDTHTKLAGVEYITIPEEEVVATVRQQSKNDKTLYFVDMDKKNEFIKMGHWNIYFKPGEEDSTTIFRHMVSQLLEGAKGTGRGPSHIVGPIQDHGMCVVFTDDIRKCDKFNELEDGFQMQSAVLPLEKFDYYFVLIKEKENIFNPYFFIVSDKYYLSHVDEYPRKTWCDEEDLVVLSMGVPCYNIPGEVEDCIEEGVKWGWF